MGTPRFGSTAQAAKLAGIGRATLHRWIREGKVPAPRRETIGGVTVRLWSEEDLEKIREYKKARYRKGRGRKKRST
ncbi:MAG TPA: helix-turn-helix domain-containing protein [Terriglobales bacterium]|nr:helix-turn-helix domain-containing protein [Terriglobales bacterium]